MDKMRRCNQLSVVREIMSLALFHELTISVPLPRRPIEGDFDLSSLDTDVGSGCQKSTSYQIIKHPAASTKQLSGVLLFTRKLL